MARIDKTDSNIGVFRAALAADVASTADYDKVLACSLDASGNVLLKDGTKPVGVTTVDRTKRKAGSIQDVMTSGEIVECAGLAAGTKYYIQDDGSIGTTVTEFYVGVTVEADRLVVRFQGGDHVEEA